jgi:hypothetical protein
MRELLILAIHLVVTFARLVLRLTTLFLTPGGIRRCGALSKPATLFKFCKALMDRKYRLLFSASSPRRKPGPKAPSFLGATRAAYGDCASGAPLA